MEILLVSPLKPAVVVLGKVTPYFFLSLINALSIIFLGKFVFGMPVTGSFVLLIAENMLFILMALSLGILISTIAETQQSAMMISMFALMLPTILLSGFIYPIENYYEFGIFKVYSGKDILVVIDLFSNLLEVLFPQCIEDSPIK